MSIGWKGSYKASIVEDTYSIRLYWYTGKSKKWERRRNKSTRKFIKSLHGLEME